MTDERDRQRLETTLVLIGHIHRRVGALALDDFSKDADEVDLTAFRLSAIGENANRLSDEIKDAHPEIPWKALYGFRNLVSHEYAMIAPRFVWAATRELDSIEAMCRTELARLESRAP